MKTPDMDKIAVVRIEFHEMSDLILTKDEYEKMNMKRWVNGEVFKYAVLHGVLPIKQIRYSARMDRKTQTFLILKLKK